MQNRYIITFMTIIQKVQNRVVNIILEAIVFFLHLVGGIPFHHVRRFFYRLAGMRIGSGSTIHTGLRLFDPRNILIGSDTIVGEGAVLDGRALLSIGSHVAIASEVMIYNSEHDILSPYFSSRQEQVVIEDYVFIGPRAIILPGVTIGKGAVVGAGAVVTKSILPYSIVGGVPAHQIGERKNIDLHYRLGRARWFR